MYHFFNLELDPDFILLIIILFKFFDLALQEFLHVTLDDCHKLCSILGLGQFEKPRLVEIILLLAALAFPSFLLFRLKF